MSKFKLLMISWWMATWFSLTQFFTQFGGRSAPLFSHPDDIALFLARGRRWRKDRPAGAMTHPLKVCRRIHTNELIGDCEDHMGVWVMGLIDSDLADATYAGLIYFTLDNGERDAHMVVVFQRDGQWYWADYGAPQSLSHRDYWIRGVLAVYGRKLRGAVLYRVSLGHLSQVRFGKTRLYLQ